LARVRTWWKGFGVGGGAGGLAMGTRGGEGVWGPP